MSSKKNININTYHESDLFQQYTYEYIKSEPGSLEEAMWIENVMRGYKIMIMHDSTKLCRPYIVSFVKELKKRNDRKHIQYFADLFNSKLLSAKNTFLFNFW